MLDYAVAVLQVRHIIVCGRSFGRESPTVETAVRDVDAPDEQHHRVAALNVVEQVFRLHHHATVQQAYEHRAAPLQLHGWVLDSLSGRVHDLAVDVRRGFDEYDIELRYQLTPDGVRELPGRRPQLPALYAVYSGCPNPSFAAGSPVCAAPDVR